MTDDVCESWEDVDVDKIVIKPNKKPTYSSILAANTKNEIDSGVGTSATVATGNVTFADNFESPLSVNNQNLNGESSSSSSFRIIQRVSNNIDDNDTDSPFTNQPKIILEDDNTRTKFVKGLRILNRPNKNSDSGKNETKSNEAENIHEKLKKSFKEKQAEYAKARLRILGEVMPDEDLVFNMTAAINLNNSSEQNQQTTQPTMMSDVFSNNNNNNKQPLLNLIRTNNDNDNERIIRQPLGPDGTRGFHHHHHHEKQ
ncbi:uncharacterized protein LOC124491522 [Dermatophagoides farinae]|uniref:uncharacterized protein LOC124491522 n=1 Tax=Dermatophagoides farinae TaxID=6954 RepID=UPI003F5D87A1